MQMPDSTLAIDEEIDRHVGQVTLKARRRISIASALRSNRGIREDDHSIGANGHILLFSVCATRCTRETCEPDVLGDTKGGYFIETSR
jgi:hypothetical protein